MSHGYHHFPYQALSADGLITSFSRTFRWDFSWNFWADRGPKLRTKTTENMGGNWKDQTKKYPKPIQRWNPPILESFSLILLDIELQQKGKLIEFLCFSSIFRASIKCLFCHNCFALSHFFGWWFDCLWARLGHATTTHEKAFLGMTDLFHASTISPFLKRGEEGM